MTFYNAAYFLKIGKYPWGASRRIYIPKLGKPDQMRPITIPPFMDRVVQQAIRAVLEAIYEPWFDKSNCSFGFRPFKGTHDAITSITGYRASSMTRHMLSKEILRRHMTE